MEQRIRWERLQLAIILIILIVSTARMLLRSNLISPNFLPWLQPQPQVPRERSNPWLWDDLAVGHGEIVLESGDELFFAEPRTSSEFADHPSASVGSKSPSPCTTPTVRSPTPVLLRPATSPNRQGQSGLFVIRNAQDSPLLRRQRSDPNLHLRRSFTPTRPPSAMSNMSNISPPSSSPLTTFLRGPVVRRPSKHRWELEAVKKLATTASVTTTLSSRESTSTSAKDESVGDGKGESSKSSVQSS